MIGQSQVQFRIAFGSDGSVQDDGFAFDDFTIAAAPSVDLGPDSTALCIGETLSVPADSTLTFDWSTGDSTNFITIQNMSGMDTTQTIVLTVTNAFGISVSDTVVVTIPAFAPTLTAMQDSAVSCFGDSTGVATAMGSGGAGMLMYSWSNGAMTQTVSGLPAGTYDVTVTDTVGCTADASVTITEPTQLVGATDTIQDALCAGDSTGAIMVTVSGGTPGYSFSWSNGDTTEDISGLPAGDYTAVATDANGCTLSSPVISVGQPDSLVLALDNLTDVQCPEDSTGAIEITVSGGTAPYSFMWSNGDMTEDLSGLPVGGYVGTITDANGCVLVSPSVAVAATDSLPEASFDYLTSGGRVEFTNTSVNGNTYEWDFGDGSPASTDTDPAHDYASNDTFIVSLTVSNDCGSVTTTDTVFMATVGIEDDLLAANVNIYPNPTGGTFNVEFGQLNFQDVAVAVYSIDGKVVYTRDLGNTPAYLRHEVHLANNLAKGIYVVRVTTRDAVMHERILLK